MAKNTLQCIQGWTKKSDWGLKFKPCEERIESLKILLEYWRLRGDLLMPYSILKIPGHLKYLLHLSPNLNLRGNIWELETKLKWTVYRHTFRSLRVVKFWNSLPADIIHATSQEIFKRKCNISLRTNYSIAL